MTDSTERLVNQLGELQRRAEDAVLNAWNGARYWADRRRALRAAATDGTNWLNELSPAQVQWLSDAHGEAYGKLQRAVTLARQFCELQSPESLPIRVLSVPPSADDPPLHDAWVRNPDGGEPIYIP